MLVVQIPLTFVICLPENYKYFFCDSLAHCIYNVYLRSNQFYEA